MGIYRGPGGTGDATQDGASQAVLSIQAKDAAIAAQTAAETSASNASTSASDASTSATNASNSATAAAASAIAAAGYSIPSQTGNNNKYLKTDGTTASWDALDISTADITGTLPLSNGGTGGTTASTARTNLGLGTAATTASTDYATAAQGTTADSAYADRLKWDGGATGLVAATGRTSLGVTATGADTTYAYRANNLSDLASASTSRTNLGLGTIATQAASAVAVTGGAIDGTTVGTTTRSSVKATTLDLGLSTQSVAIGQGNASIMKNRIINGAMVIDQRNAGASLTITSSGYPVDRFIAYGEAADGVFTAQQTTTAPVGFANSTKITVTTADSSIGATQRYLFGQRVEGCNIADMNFGSANAKTFTFSFWVNSSVTGTFGGAFQNTGSVRSYPFTYTISAANTWEQKTITVAGDTSGTWDTTNGTGIQFWFSIGAGSTYLGTPNSWATANYLGASGQTNLIATNGATFYITGVQLEVGSSATGFEYVNYQTSLANCQRYYYKFLNNNGVGTGWYGQATTSLSTTRSIGSPITLPVPARTTPSVSFSNLNLVNVQGNTTYAVTVANIYSGYSLYGTSFALDLTTSGITAGTVYFFYIADGGSVAYSMEL
jgi:hypothetical protein